MKPVLCAPTEYSQPDATAEILKESPSPVIIRHLNHNGHTSLARAKNVFK